MSYNLYVVWAGRQPGIYASWGECQAQVKGFPGALFKGFMTRADAEEALARPPAEYIAVAAPGAVPAQPLLPSVCVDASLRGSWPNVRMEYRGVWTDTKVEFLHVGPLPGGTNNIGEFLAIVDALRLFNAEHPSLTIYSDSRIALRWVAERECRSKHLQGVGRAHAGAVVEAVRWLRREHPINPLRYWSTKEWGDIPADFQRKGKVRLPKWVEEEGDEQPGVSGPDALGG